MQSFAKQRGIFPRPILFVFIWLLMLGVSAHAQPVELAVHAGSVNDTFFVGVPATLSFTMNSDTTHVAGFQLPLVWTFTNGNIVGPLEDGTHVFWSVKAASIFELLGWDIPWGSAATDPDSTKAACTDFDLSGWIGSGEVYRVQFTPSDTGTFSLDTIFFQDTLDGEVLYTIHPEVVDPLADLLPMTWSGGTYTVAECPVAVTGDLNLDGAVNAADVILLVNAVFLCDFGICFPACFAAADANCNGSVTSADIIVLVNFIFRGDAPPCDVCPLILDGRWSCP